MARILKATKIREARLWIVLSERKCEGSQALSANVATLCEEAIDRMKAIYAYAPQYTLHDDRHLLRTTELMGLVLGSQVEQLNTVELTLLILSGLNTHRHGDGKHGAELFLKSGNLTISPTEPPNSQPSTPAHA